MLTNPVVLFLWLPVSGCSCCAYLPDSFLWSFLFFALVGLCILQPCSGRVGWSLILRLYFYIAEVCEESLVTCQCKLSELEMAAWSWKSGREELYEILGKETQEFLFLSVSSVWSFLLKIMWFWGAEKRNHIKPNPSLTAVNVKLLFN